MLDEIRLKPCSCCEGAPVVLIVPGWPYPTIGIRCSECGHSGPRIYFTGQDTWYHGVDTVLLPGLATARRQAAAAWNERTGVDGQN